jgi:spermidine synthase
VVILLAATLFAGSALLFLVQPIFAKMVLPFVGGAPAMWNTCVMGFQIALLAGYGYAHLSTTRLALARQVVLHVFLLTIAALALPIGLRMASPPPPDSSPIPWLIAGLAVSVALPFFVISATAPMLQRWFSVTRHRSASDPFFLYSASNAGSIVGLLSYPLLLEPALRLDEQSLLWTGGYGVLAILATVCGLLCWRDVDPAMSSTPNGADSNGMQVSSVGGRERGTWMFLAAVPSSLMLGVTTYVSTDIATVPLLWIIPLVLYLLSFIVAFSVKSQGSRGHTPTRGDLAPSRSATAAGASERLVTPVSRALPLLVLPMLLMLFTKTTLSAGLIIPFHLVTFFAAALVCHLRLFASRPSAAHLTEFYLWIAVGGMLGGIFNSLVAPALFTEIAEYPLALVAACALMPDRAPRDAAVPWRGGLVRIALVAALTAIIVIVELRIGLSPSTTLLLLSVPAVLTLSTVRYARYFGAAAGVIAAAGILHTASYGSVIHSERTFFGIHHVVSDMGGRYHALYHGTTLHGRQSLDPQRALDPLAYYHRTGPIGEVIGVFTARVPKAHVGVVGLGTGALAAYAERGQEWTFFEIDPAVARIAADPRYFTYLQRAAVPPRIVLGDARLSLSRVAPHTFDLLILDAFSSDAVPVHLLTREALEIYRRTLTDDGLLAFHISNRHLDLEPVLGTLAETERFSALVRTDPVTPESAADGKAASVWLVMSQSAAALLPLSRDRRWTAPHQGIRSSLWTDDYSNIWSVFKGG